MKTPRLLPTALPAILVTLVLSPAGLLAAPAPGDEHWDKQFGPVGANATLWSVTVKDGDVYAGGIQSAAGNTRANYIAGYDGTNWFALNNGIQGDYNATYVFALEKDDKYVYAGGWFTNADNCGAYNIARWDGTNWSAMGGRQLSGYVMSLKWVGTNLYAGGVFPSNTVDYALARWGGTNWIMIPGDFAGGAFGISGVTSVATDGTNIYVGGAFTSVSGVVATNVIGWNGSSWFTLGNGVPGNVQAVYWQNNRLYAGGTFTNTIGSLCTNLAVWNGSTWSAFGNPDRQVSVFLGDGTNLYVGGEFRSIGGVSTRAIAMWDGVNWSGLGAGIRGSANSLADVYDLCFDASGRLYAVGGMTLAGDIGAANIACWDGANWSALGATTSQGTDFPFGRVRSFLPDGTNLYVGGLFTAAGNQIVGSIAKWDGYNWTNLGIGFTNTFTSVTAPPFVNSLALLDADLYAGGNFTNAGGFPAKGIAFWDGNNWNGVGDSDATVSALAYDGFYLWVGGAFTNIGGGFSPGLAIYAPGGGWFNTGAPSVSGGNQTVNAITVDESGNLYIGGNFTSISGVSLTNIAFWSWTQGGWNALGSGVNNTVSALAVSNGVVYAGGTFTSAGGTPANRIAKWDGSSWSALGTGMTGTSASASVNAIAIHGDDVYAGGTFTNAGGVVVTGLAKWNGTNWSGLGSGVIMSPGSPAVNALAFIGNDLFVGGQFIFAGDKPSMFVARWNDQLNFYPPPNLNLTRPAWLTNGQFQLRVAGTSGERYTIQASTDLNIWTPILTNTATLYDFTDAGSTNFPARMYRAVLGP